MKFETPKLRMGLGGDTYQTGSDFYYWWLCTKFVKTCFVKTPKCISLVFSSVKSKDSVAIEFCWNDEHEDVFWKFADKYSWKRGFDLYPNLSSFINKNANIKENGPKILYVSLYEWYK